MLPALLLVVSGFRLPRAQEVPAAGKTARTTSAVAVTWPLPEPYKISQSDMDFGEKQVKQMVRDRPAMANGVDRKSALWTWCVRHFAGSSLGQRIYWHDEDVTSTVGDAEHEPPYAGENGYIRIRKTHTNDDGSAGVASTAELWSDAVFELNNMDNDAEFVRLFEEARANKLTKQAYMEQTTRLEYRAARKTGLAYRHLWKRTKTSPANEGDDWFADVPATYEAWIAEYTDHKKYPWNPYEKDYDDITAPYQTALAVAPDKTPEVAWPLPVLYKVTADDLAFGDKQVESMLHDRPQMARNIDRQSPIWQWCARQFAGEAYGQRIDWNRENPAAANNGGSSGGPENGTHAYIQVDGMQPGADGKPVPRSCSALWCLAVYHLIGLINRTEFDLTYYQALAGKLSRDQYIEKNTRLDYLNIRKTALVYEHVWQNSRQAKLDDNSDWYPNTPATYQAWIAQYTDRNSYPWNYYGKNYDELIAPQAKKDNK